MLAATYLAPRRIESIEIPEPRALPGEAVVRVHACGICGSDLSIVSGTHPRAKAPLIIGHEFAGEVTQLPDGLVQPDGAEVQVGDRVSLFPLLTCGKCFACRNGFSHVCNTLRLVGFDQDGGMAEYARVPVNSLVKIPEGLDWEGAALIEPVAVCVHAFRRANVHCKQRAIVLGAGPIGLLMAMVLQAEGLYRIMITDVNSFRLAIAKSLGLDAINPAETSLRERVLEATNGEGADVVFEAAGTQATADQMCQIVRPRATIVNVSVFKTPPSLDMRTVNFLELTIVGSRVYERSDFARAIEIVRLPGPRRIITHRFPVDRVSDAFDILARGADACKILIIPTAAP